MSYFICISHILIAPSLSKRSDSLEIKLFAKRSRDDDILLAQATWRLDSFGDDGEHKGT